MDCSYAVIHQACGRICQNFVQLEALADLQTDWILAKRLSGYRIRLDQARKTLFDLEIFVIAVCRPTLFWVICRSTVQTSCQQYLLQLKLIDLTRHLSLSSPLPSLPNANQTAHLQVLQITLRKSKFLYCKKLGLVDWSTAHSGPSFHSYIATVNLLTHATRRLPTSSTSVLLRLFGQRHRCEKIIII